MKLLNNRGGAWENVVSVPPHTHALDFHVHGLCTDEE